MRASEVAHRGVSSVLFLLVLPVYALPFVILTDTCEVSVTERDRATFT